MDNDNLYSLSIPLSQTSLPILISLFPVKFLGARYNYCEQLVKLKEMEKNRVVGLRGGCSNMSVAESLPRPVTNEEEGETEVDEALLLVAITYGNPCLSTLMLVTFIRNHPVYEIFWTLLDQFGL